MVSLNPIRPLYIVFALLVALLWSCAWSHPPSSERIPHKPFKLNASSDDESPIRARKRNFYLSDVGLWALEYPNSVRNDTPSVPDIETGRIYEIHFQESYRGQLETKETHLFVALLERSWGYMFQRLNRGPINHLTQSDTVTVDGFDVSSNQSHWCISHSNHCSQADDGTRRLVYNLTEKTKLQAPPASEWSRTMPIKPTALDPSNDAEKSRRLIVHLDESRYFPYRGVTGYRDDCFQTSENSFRHAVSDVKRPSHPLEIEAENRYHGTDALAWCKNNKIHLGLPNLFRPPIHSSDDGFDMTPYGLNRILVFQRANIESDRLLRFGENLGARDFLGAHFHQARLLRSVQTQPTQQKLLLGGMGIAAAAGFPEAGLRYGYFAQHSMWNPSFSLPFQIGILQNLRALGLEHAAMRLRRQIPSRALPENNAQIREWIAWNQKRGLGFDQLPEAELPETKKWAFARQYLPDASENSKTDRSSNQKSSRLRGLRRTSNRIPKNQITTYGQNLDNILSRIANGTVKSTDAALQIAHRIESGLPNQFNPDKIVARPLEPAQKVTLLLPLLTFEKVRSETFDAMSSLVVKMAISGQLCKLEIPARLPALLNARMKNRLDSIKFTGNLIGDSKQLCKNPKSFVELLIQSTNYDEKTTELAFQMLEISLRYLDGAELRHRVLDKLLDKLEVPGRYCQKWRLARLFAYIESGRLDDAIEQMDKISECPETEDQQLNDQRELAKLVIESEKSGFLLERQKRRKNKLLSKLVSPTKQSCPGLVELTTSFRDSFPVSLRPLISRLITAQSSESNLSRWSKSARLKEAIENLEKVPQMLRQGKCPEALSSLKKANNIFNQLEYQPGYFRTQLLADVFPFDKKPEQSCGQSLTNSPQKQTIPEADRLIDAVLKGQIKDLKRVTGLLSEQNIETLSKQQRNAILAATLLFELEKTPEKIQQLYKHIEAAGFALCHPGP